MNDYRRQHAMSTTVQTIVLSNIHVKAAQIDACRVIGKQVFFYLLGADNFHLLVLHRW